MEQRGVDGSATEPTPRREVRLCPLALGACETGDRHSDDLIRPELDRFAPVGRVEVILTTKSGRADPTCGLDVEIIEGILLGESDAAVRKLERLRAAGVRIAVDDFGTGYSSLSRLSELPIDTLKTDRCFISRLPDDRSGRTLVSTIISLARAFGMTVVAEGVETEQQIGALWNMGCDEAQGFLMSPQVPGDEIAHLLEHGKGRLMLPVARHSDVPGEGAGMRVERRER